MFGLFFGFICVVVMINLFSGESSEDYQRHHMDDFQQQQFDQHNRWAMEESRKSVTPFEMGGYDMTQGNSWNNDCGGGGFNNFGGMF